MGGSSPRRSAAMPNTGGAWPAPKQPRFMSVHANMLAFQVHRPVLTGYPVSFKKNRTDTRGNGGGHAQSVLSQLYISSGHPLAHMLC